MDRPVHQPAVLCHRTVRRGSLAIVSSLTLRQDLLRRIARVGLDRRKLRVACSALAIAVMLVAIGGVSTAAFGPSLSAQTHSSRLAFTAKVTGVVDGDTLHVVDEAGVSMNIRVEGIDCPESGQPYGGAALRFTRAAVFDRQVQIRVLDKDSHGRLVARVEVDGRDLSVLLLRAGLAWHYTEFSRDVLLAASERRSREAKRGLWSKPNPVAPWVWRRQSRVVRPDAQEGPFVGNTSRRVFHAAACRNAHCKNCTVTFPTAQAAEAAGYRPAGDCLR